VVPGVLSPSRVHVHRYREDNNVSPAARDERDMERHARGTRVPSRRLPRRGTSYVQSLKLYAQPSRGGCDVNGTRARRRFWEIRASALTLSLCRPLPAGPRKRRDNALMINAILRQAYVARLPSRDFV